MRLNTEDSEVHSASLKVSRKSWLSRVIGQLKIHFNDTAFTRNLAGLSTENTLEKETCIRRSARFGHDCTAADTARHDNVSTSIHRGTDNKIGENPIRGTGTRQRRILFQSGTHHLPSVQPNDATLLTRPAQPPTQLAQTGKLARFLSDGTSGCRIRLIREHLAMS
jgi:hypothetical protein